MLSFEKLAVHFFTSPREKNLTAFRHGALPSSFPVVAHFVETKDDKKKMELRVEELGEFTSHLYGTHQKG